jgi:ATP-dependent RNA helicase RhlB
MRGINAAGFTECTPVQAKVLPGALEGRDIMAQSKTGSGKTAVFVIAILQKFVLAREELKKMESEEAFKAKLPVALIIAPTRELAVQIEEDTKVLASGIKDFRIGCFYGGVGYVKQNQLVEEGLDLIIGTPGRLLDYQQMGRINFKGIDTFVIDEADRLFDMGFYVDIQKMFRMMVDKERRQTMLFSATLGTRVRNLAWSFMNNPLEIAVEPEEITVKEITQELYHISRDEKFALFLALLAKENPSNALIFTNTKSRAVEISKRLNLNGYKAQFLMGDLPQSKRLQIINRMKRGELRFLVATDVAARGLQIDDLELVVNYDIPEDFENYVHRIGRTARAGKSGKSITLACEQFVYSLEAIEEYIQMKIPVIWPEEGSLPKVEDKSAHLSFRDLDGGRRPKGTAQRRGTPPPRRGQSQQRRSGPPQQRKSASPPPKAKSSTPPAKPKSSSQGKKSYNEIGKMGFDERIAYYKKVYSGEEEKSPPVKPVKEEVKVEPVAKKKRFPRLFKGRKKDV